MSLRGDEQTGGERERGETEREGGDGEREGRQREGGGREGQSSKRSIVEILQHAQGSHVKKSCFWRERGHSLTLH